jgi:3-hydroxybutyryl-CoA dehydrogenase
MKIKKVCIIGAGTMGNGIVQVCAQAGYETVMCDLKQEFLDKGMAAIKNSLSIFVSKGKIKQTGMKKALALIHPSTNLRESAKNADFVIESVFERADVKRTVFNQLDEICPKHTILSSNTSSIPISLLGSMTKRPDKVIGLHFGNPVPVAPNMEIIRSLLTSDDTARISLAFTRSLGKEATLVKDSPGFVANRIIPLVINECAKMLEDDLASASDINEIIKRSLGAQLGPFTWAELAGVDVIVDLLEQIYQQTGWERYKPAPLLKRMAESGYLGRKTGKGFDQMFGVKK